MKTRERISVTEVKRSVRSIDVHNVLKILNFQIEYTSLLARSDNSQRPFRSVGVHGFVHEDMEMIEKFCGVPVISGCVSIDKCPERLHVVRSNIVPEVASFIGSLTFSGQHHNGLARIICNAVQ